MVKAKDDITRESYSVRLNPDLISRLKHLAVDEKKPISQLIEEGIEDLLKKYSKKGR
ncbi:MAG: ribbon-helix-helix domain-containing protein [Nitrospirota bacterium]|nr:ribbon-helix-helix domain-containing protein [Nitrospirota bacterium]